MSKATLSIDWEDFGQLFGKYHCQNISAPTKGAIDRQTDIILEMLDEADHKATFFVLGMLAKYKPQLVKKIASKGHEIALHGNKHEAMFNLTPAQAREDLVDSYKIVTDIIGAHVAGYRAPFFSVNKSNLYLLETLADLGFLYDSSIFPLAMSRYGINNFDEKDTLYRLPNGKELVELPLTVATYFGKKLPVSGGGYIRLMPKILVNKVFKDFEKNNKDCMIYMHPYEFDTEKIDVAANYPKEASRSNLKVHGLNFRWNLFRDSVRYKIKDLLKKHQFVTCLEKATYVKNNGNCAELLGR